MIPSDPYGEIQMLLAGLPDSAPNVVAKSREFRDDDEIDFAFELLRQAVERDPAPVLLAELADLLAAEGRREEAVETAMSALGAESSSGYAREVLSRVLTSELPRGAARLADAAWKFAENGDVEFAEDLFVDAVEAAPENILLREQTARFYAEHRRVDDCIVHLEALLALDPEHENALAMLAAAFIKKGELPRAQKLLERARLQGIDPQMLQKLERKIGAVVDVIARSRKNE